MTDGRINWILLQASPTLPLDSFPRVHIRCEVRLIALRSGGGIWRVVIWPVHCRLWTGEYQALVEWQLTVKNCRTGTKTWPTASVSSTHSYGMPWDRIWASLVSYRQLTTWAIAWHRSGGEAKVQAFERDCLAVLMIFIFFSVNEKLTEIWYY
jgi:hypothetical protein